MAERQRWRVRLTTSAETDFQDILRWTSERFGETQANTYADTLSEAIKALTAGPDVTGARPRDDIAEGLMALHVTRDSRKGRHFVLYRAGGESEPFLIDVLRLLHDAMDLPRHLETD